LAKQFIFAETEPQKSVNAENKEESNQYVCFCSLCHGKLHNDPAFNLPAGRQGGAEINF
jgi:cytochrome c553